MRISSRVHRYVGCIPLAHPAQHVHSAPPSPSGACSGDRDPNAAVVLNGERMRGLGVAQLLSVAASRGDAARAVDASVDECGVLCESLFSMPIVLLFFCTIAIRNVLPT